MPAAIRYRDHAGSSSSRNEVVMAVDVRCWIMGVEVSDYLVGEVSVTRAAGETEGTCSFTLDNNFDRFIIRPENLGGKSPSYRYDQGTSPADVDNFLKTGILVNSAAEVKNSDISWIEDKANDQRNTFTFDESAKRALFEYKALQILSFANVANAASVNQYSTGGSTGSTPMASTSQASWVLPKYDLTVGACAINIHDEVRLFVADPNLDPLSDSAGRWMPLFSGVVSGIPVKHSRTQGNSDISVSCADIRYILKKMRIAGNFQSADQKKTYVHFDSAVGMFQDTIAASSEGNLKFENNVSSLSYRQITRAVLCGDTISDVQSLDVKNKAFGTAVEQGNKVPVWDRLGGVNPYADKVVSPRSHSIDKFAKMEGVGTFSLGLELTTNIAADADRAGVGIYVARGAFYERWNDICLFGIKQDWYSDADIEEIGGGTKPFDIVSSYVDRQAAGGTDTQSGTPSPYSIFNGFVHYLFPGPNTESLGIRNAMERMLISPGSDVNFQNRLDILAQTSNQIDYKFYVTPIGDVVFEYAMYDFMPNAFGKYAACCVVHDSVKDDEFNDEGDGNVVTGLVVRGGFESVDTAPTDGEQNPTVADQGFALIVKSDYMAAKYGITVEDHSIAWLNKIWPIESQTPSGEKIDTNALNRNSLASFGVIEFYRRIAAMSSMSYTGIYNPFLLPNRPAMNRIIRRMGITTSCSIGIPIDGAPTSSVETFFVRKADHNGQFKTICGSGNTPFDYSGAGLNLFSVSQLDGLRFAYGIEIIDPTKSKVDDAKPEMVAAASGSGPVYSGGSTGSGSASRYSVSPVVARAFARYDAMASSNPRLHKMIADTAASVGMDPHILYQLMCFESGGGDKINPQGLNKNGGTVGGGARGVIQFIPSTLIGMGIDPNTFLRDYPTVESQMPLVQRYLKAVAGGKALSTPYDAYMAIANPASRKDDPLTPFSQSANKTTRKRAGNIAKFNNGAQCGADFLMAVGYNYYNAEGGTFTDRKGRKTSYTAAGNQSASPAVAASASSTVAAKPAGLAVKPVTTSAALTDSMLKPKEQSFAPTKKNVAAAKAAQASPPKPVPVVTPSVTLTTTQVVKSAVNKATNKAMNEKIVLPDVMVGAHR